MENHATNHAGQQQKDPAMRSHHAFTPSNVVKTKGALHLSPDLFLLNHDKSIGALKLPIRTLHLSRVSKTTYMFKSYITYIYILYLFLSLKI